ncbi:MAG: PIG-L family deacetylase [Acetobacteraceae bacterium]|nr:PIG-L family deacetylase [Acetobacteraceae bacterium]
MRNAPPDITFLAGQTEQETLSRWQARAREIDVGTLLGDVQSLGIIVPHADDETLGSGGLIALAATLGISVTVTILTDGAASHPGSNTWPPAALARQRQQEARDAVKCLAGTAATVQFLDAPDGGLAGNRNLADRIGPADVYITCWRDDPHPDHRAAFFIARTVARRRGSRLLAFPLWVLTTSLPVPNLPLFRICVTDFLQHKQIALAAHRSQLGELVEDVIGFVLDKDLQRLFVRDDELYLEVIA